MSITKTIMVACLLLAGCSANQVCLEEKCFDVEIADSNAERQLGLMNRESLAEDSGMLFVFDEARIYPFWMKNTLISLDMIWIMDDTIVHIQRNALPCTEVCPSIDPGVQANYVLEINGGLADKYNIAEGDKVTLDIST